MTPMKSSGLKSVPRTENLKPCRPPDKSLLRLTSVGQQQGLRQLDVVGGNGTCVCPPWSVPLSDHVVEQHLGQLGVLVQVHQVRKTVGCPPGR